MIRAVFFDVDGTLVSFNTHKVPESAFLAMRTLQDHGVRVFVATGRASDGLGVLEHFPFDGYITMNGQLCYTREGEIIHESTLSPEDIRSLTSYEQTHHFPMCFFTQHEKIFNYRDKRVEELHRATNNIPHPVGDLSDIDRKPVYQVMTLINETQQQELSALMPDCFCARWHPLCCDIMPKSGTKVKGMEKFLAYYGIRQEETMAFGDGGNDLQMLQYAAVSVAMGNASDELKDAADYVTEDVDHDGIWKAMAHFRLPGF